MNSKVDELGLIAWGWLGVIISFVNGWCEQTSSIMDVRCTQNVLSGLVVSKFGV